MVERIFDCKGNYIIPHTFLRYKDETIYEVLKKYRFGSGMLLGIKMNDKFVFLADLRLDEENKLIDFEELSELKNLIDLLKIEIVSLFDCDEKARYILIYDPAYLKQYLCSVFKKEYGRLIPLILYKAIKKYVDSLPKYDSYIDTIRCNLIKKRY